MEYGRKNCYYLESCYLRGYVVLFRVKGDEILRVKDIGNFVDGMVGECG